MTTPEYKRFMVFSCPEYYPAGGLSDVVDSFDTLEEAKEDKKVQECGNDGFCVFDRIEGEVVYRSWLKDETPQKE